MQNIQTMSKMAADLGQKDDNNEYLLSEDEVGAALGAAELVGGHDPVDGLVLGRRLEERHGGRARFLVVAEAAGRVGLHFLVAAVPAHQRRGLAADQAAQRGALLGPHHLWLQRLRELGRDARLLFLCKIITEFHALAQLFSVLFYFEK